MADLVKNGEPSTRPSIASQQADLGPDSDSIPLYVVNGVATVWDAQVAATLHCVHNVSGLRAGTLPGVAQQNGFLGLPLTLMKEEAAYLVQEGIAHLVALPTFPPLPSSDQLAAHTAARKARIEHQENLAKQFEDQKKLVSAQAFEKGGEKARAKREARARAKAEKEAQAQADRDKGDDGLLFGAETKTETAKVSREGDNEGRPESLDPTGAITSDTTNGDARSYVQDPAIPSAQTTTSSPAATAPAAPAASSSGPGHFHVIPSHPSHPSLVFSSEASTSPSQQRITSLPHPSVFPFPSTARDVALLAVFTSLQRKGYRMGLGPRFGGEYLVYPGDYLRYHAHFTSQVLVDDECIRPAEIVAWGRLGTGTKKAGLICSFDQRKTRTNISSSHREDPEDPVEFYSLEWANFG
ncbi:tRNA-splicing endonuclease subunit Sen34 [Kwoniella heveanensis BCC8398]|uniref:tRNA-intron lyase n=1 Tax=Kwoniella heveanensis BCC8398 TaxID=1296120 RepID=A0A1B9GMT5_9TREE|nr:tRNA-splicing endonuclease subunit Sen34 [Kwoniella heveanensis BCC8398]